MLNAEPMFGLVVLVVITLPFVARALRKTPIWWLPALLLAATALLAFSGYESNSHGEESAMVGLGNAICVFAGGTVSVMALIAFVVGAPRPAQPQEPELARATVFRY